MTLDLSFRKEKILRINNIFINDFLTRFNFYTYRLHLCLFFSLKKIYVIINPTMIRMLN